MPRTSIRINPVVRRNTIILPLFENDVEEQRQQRSRQKQIKSFIARVITAALLITMTVTIYSRIYPSLLPSSSIDRHELSDGSKQYDTQLLIETIEALRRLLRNEIEFNKQLSNEKSQLQSQLNIAAELSAKLANEKLSQLQKNVIMPLHKENESLQQQLTIAKEQNEEFRKQLTTAEELHTARSTHFGVESPAPSPPPSSPSPPPSRIPQSPLSSSYAISTEPGTSTPRTSSLSSEAEHENDQLRTQIEEYEKELRQLKLMQENLGISNREYAQLEVANQDQVIEIKKLQTQINQLQMKNNENHQLQESYRKQLEKLLNDREIKQIIRHRSIAARPPLSRTVRIAN